MRIPSVLIRVFVVLALVLAVVAVLAPSVEPVSAFDPCGISPIPPGCPGYIDPNAPHQCPVTQQGCPGYFDPNAPHQCPVTQQGCPGYFDPNAPHQCPVTQRGCPGYVDPNLPADPLPQVQQPAPTDGRVNWDAGDAFVFYCVDKGIAIYSATTAGDSAAVSFALVAADGTDGGVIRVGDSELSISLAYTDDTIIVTIGDSFSTALPLGQCGG